MDSTNYAAYVIPVQKGDSKVNGENAVEASYVDFSCTPQIDHSTRILARHPDKIVWEIMEATEIARLQDHCVSAPSIALSEKELKCLQGPMFIFANAHS